MFSKNKLAPSPVLIDSGHVVETFKWEIKVDFEREGVQVRADFPDKHSAMQAANEMAAKPDCVYVEVARRYA